MNKLTERDLMVGDWVLYNPNVFIEDEYELPKDPYPTKISCGEDIDLAFEDCYNPIPITAQILEKNGFELYEQDFTSSKVYVFDKGFTYIEDCGNYFDIGAKVEYEHFGGKIRCISSTIKVYYIHQLQHALRLAGINKEITI